MSGENINALADSGGAKMRSKALLMLADYSSSEEGSDVDDVTASDSYAEPYAFQDVKAKQPESTRDDVEMIGRTLSSCGNGETYEMMHKDKGIGKVPFENSSEEASMPDGMVAISDTSFIQSKCSEGASETRINAATTHVDIALTVDMCSVAKSDPGAHTNNSDGTMDETSIVKELSVVYEAAQCGQQEEKHSGLSVIKELTVIHDIPSDFLPDVENVPVNDTTIIGTENDGLVVDREGLYRDSLAKPFSEDSESDSTDSETDTDDASSSTSTQESETEEDKRDAEERRRWRTEKKKEFGPMTKGELCLMDLPPIEHLHISLPEDQCTCIGKVASVVGTLVVVQASPGTPALDIDSVLFLDKGRRPLGRVYDVMGQVTEPAYCVRFNTTDEVEEFGVKIDADVYFAPGSEEHCHFVFVDALRKLRGSDASWLDGNEPPDSCRDFSDDEQERAYKRQNRKRPQNGDMPLPQSDRSGRFGAGPREMNSEPRGRGGIRSGRDRGLRHRDGGFGSQDRPPWMPNPPRNPFYRAHNHSRATLGPRPIFQTRPSWSHGDDWSAQAFSVPPPSVSPVPPYMAQSQPSTYATDFRNSSAMSRTMGIDVGTVGGEVYPQQPSPVFASGGIPVDLQRPPPPTLTSASNSYVVSNRPLPMQLDGVANFSRPPPPPSPVQSSPLGGTRPLSAPSLIQGSSGASPFNHHPPPNVQSSETRGYGFAQPPPCASPNFAQGTRENPNFPPPPPPSQGFTQPPSAIFGQPPPPLSPAPLILGRPEMSFGQGPSVSSVLGSRAAPEPFPSFGGSDSMRMSCEDSFRGVSSRSAQTVGLSEVYNREVVASEASSEPLPPGCSAVPENRLTLPPSLLQPPPPPPLPPS